MSLNIAAPAISSASSSVSFGSGELGKLKKQLIDLFAKLRQVSQGAGDAKQKMQQAKIIQTQIQLLQAQIQELEKGSRPENANSSSQKRQGSNNEDPRRLLDVYA